MKYRDDRLNVGKGCVIYDHTYLLCWKFKKKKGLLKDLMTPPNAMEGAGQLFCQMVSWSSAVAPLVRIQTGQMSFVFFYPAQKKERIKQAKYITHTSIYALFTKIILDT